MLSLNTQSTFRGEPPDQRLVISGSVSSAIGVGTTNSTVDTPDVDDDCVVRSISSIGSNGGESEGVGAKSGRELARNG